MSQPLPEIPALRLLVAVEAFGSIGAAARDQGISQQAASERIRAMETQVGLSLVQRGARGSRLTDAGVIVASWARRLLDLADETAAAIDGLRTDKSRGLAVWASTTVAESLLPRWLVQLRQRQLDADEPPTAVSLTAANTRSVLEAVRAGAADLGFVEGVDAPSGVRHQAVASDELILVAAPGSALADSGGRGSPPRPLTPEQVAKLPLTSRERGSGSREVLEVALAAHGLTMGDAVIELTTATTIRAAVLARSSPAFLSRRLVERDIEQGLLVEVPTRDLNLTRVFRAVWVGGRVPPIGPVRDLVAIARQDGAQDGAQNGATADTIGIAP